MKKNKKVILNFLLFTEVLCSVFAGILVSRNDSNNVKALYILPDRFGANNYLMLDDLESYGWDVTIAGTSSVINPCPGAASVFGAKQFIADVELSNPIDVNEYDCIIIGPATWRSGEPYGDLMLSTETLQLLQTADNENLTIYATCAGIRVLGEAGILNGVHVTGQATFESEFESYGAIFEGTGILPIVDGNIVTTSRGLYFHLQNSDAIASTVQNLTINEVISGGGSEITETESDLNKTIWAKTIGGSDADEFKSISAVNENEFITAGYTFSNGNGNSDILLTKFNDEGNILWTKTYGTAGWEYANSVNSNADGSFIVAGYVNAPATGSKDVLVVKFDPEGNEIWNKNIGGADADVGMSVIETSDNNYIICGYTESFGHGRDDVYLIKLDQNGDEIWTKTFGGEMSDRGNYAINTGDGKIALVGSTGSFGTGNRDIYFIKMDLDGNILIETYYHDSNYDRGTSLAQTKDGGFVITGCSDLYESEPMDMYLLKIDADGNREWDKKYKEGYFYDYGSGVLQSEDGGYILAGTSKFHEVGNEVYTVKTDQYGEVQWKRLMGGKNSDWGNNLIITEDGDFIIIGRTKSFGSGSSDGLILKTSAMNPDFDIEPKSGHIPMEIQINNKSTGSITEWKWDFDGDGSFDSFEQNPNYTFTSPGEFFPVLEVSNGKYILSKQYQTKIKVFDGESAVGFDNNSGFVSCRGNEAMNFIEDFTIEAWIYPTGWAESQTGQAVLFTKGSIEIYFNKEAGDVEKENSLVIMLSFTNGTKSYMTTSENIIQFNQWQHIAVTYNSTNSYVAAYINGIRKSLTPYDALPNGPLKDHLNYTLGIGNKSFLHKPYKGLIDEIRIWNEEKSNAQILENFRTYLEGNETGLVAYWNMNEGNGEIIIDKTTNGFQAQLSSVSWEQSADFPSITDIKEMIANKTNLPAEFKLNQNYPNPFNPTTIIEYSIPSQSPTESLTGGQTSAGLFTTLIVYDGLGKKISTLVNEEQKSGTYKIEFNPGNLATGIYFYSLTASGFTTTKKMVYIK